MADSIFRSYYSVETILGMVNQFHTLVDLPYVPDVSTTLNTKHGVYASTTPTIVPTVRYFGIGIKGYYNVDDGVLSQPYKPSAGNMDLYQPIPFRIVPVDEDLTEAERANYRLRTLTTVNGVDYYAYWLKLIEFPTNEINLTQIEPNGTETEYTLDASNLNPIPVKSDTPDVVDPNSNQITVSVSCVGNITGEEVVEAITVLYEGDMRLAKVSEFGFYTGEDIVATGVAADSSTFNYTEAAYVQLSSHRCTTGTDLSDPTAIHAEYINFVNGNMTLSG